MFHCGFYCAIEYAHAYMYMCYYAINDRIGKCTCSCTFKKH